ncbi:hypothetical protein CAEBREN_16980 [Caenorhabditis brenneri]|uniref:Uncharacterized protein n=1 Tax=Caenorhabditis brenneri TaxID=135651 RepID=G0PHT6_CAEBE|nr:hypothetical protein CAEBREN_16980 [Caenorhabditis brenneri]
MCFWDWNAGYFEFYQYRIGSIFKPSVSFQTNIDLWKSCILWRSCQKIRSLLLFSLLSHHGPVPNNTTGATKSILQLHPCHLLRPLLTMPLQWTTTLPRLRRNAVAPRVAHGSYSPLQSRRILCMGLIRNGVCTCWQEEIYDHPENSIPCTFVNGATELIDCLEFNFKELTMWSNQLEQLPPQPPSENECGGAAVLDASHRNCRFDNIPCTFGNGATKLIDYFEFKFEEELSDGFEKTTGPSSGIYRKLKTFQTLTRRPISVDDVSSQSGNLLPRPPRTRPYTFVDPSTVEWPESSTTTQKVQKPEQRKKKSFWSRKDKKDKKVDIPKPKSEAEELEILPQQPYFRKGLKLQLRRTTYKNVDGLIFVFNAVEKDRANELEHFVKVWKMLASESPNAKLYVFLHRANLIQESRTETLRDFGMKLIASMVEAQARPHELKLLATSVFDRESVFDAWSTVFRSLCGTSEGWSKCVSSCFGLGTNDRHLGGINENQSS